MIIGSIIQGVFANKAADAQSDAAAAGIDAQRQNFVDGLEVIQPQIDSGNRARQALEFELGLGERPTFTPEGPDNLPPLNVVTVPGGPQYETYNEGDNELRRLTGFDVEKFAVGDQEFTTRAAADAHLNTLLAQRDADATAAAGNGFEYQGFQQTPGYQFQMDEGQKAIERSAAARGMVLSSPTVKDFTRFSQGLADQTYGNHLNRLSALSGSGQVASGQAFAGFQNNGANIANLLGQQGNAQAAGASSFGQAIGSGVNNIFRGAGLFGGF